MPWRIAQLRACGHDEIDISTLKPYTKVRQNRRREENDDRSDLGDSDESQDMEFYRNVDEIVVKKQVKWCFEALESFTQEERRMYLKFVGGRSKLPLNLED